MAFFSQATTRVLVANAMTATTKAVDFEVGETVPPLTAHVSHQLEQPDVEVVQFLNLTGNQRVVADMERQCGLRGGPGMGYK